MAKAYFFDTQADADAFVAVGYPKDGRKIDGTSASNVAVRAVNPFFDEQTKKWVVEDCPMCIEAKTDGVNTGDHDFVADQAAKDQTAKKAMGF